MLLAYGPLLPVGYTNPVGVVSTSPAVSAVTVIGVTR